MRPFRLSSYNATISLFLFRFLTTSTTTMTAALSTATPNANLQDRQASKLSSTTTGTMDDNDALPKIWKPVELGGKWGGVNQPTAGARFDRKLSVGEHPLQLYSLATPNGVKVTILLEELLELGITEAEYDAWLISIGGDNCDQFGSDFVELNPNSKIPALKDYSVQEDDNSDDDEPLAVFESGSILVYLADKFGKFLPPTSKVRARTETMNWLMWQMGSAPFLGGGFGHFFSYAPVQVRYAIDRYTMETKRQLDVLNQHLATRTYMVGEEYSIADMAIWSWYGQLVLGQLYGGSVDFLDVHASYPHVVEWAQRIADRPAVQRGCMVNKTWGPPETQLLERHSASDFEQNNEAEKQKRVALE